ncbi:WGR domain-containing protein, partial [Streptomyces scabiei]|uniref:WGR domain-containing protein n=1 Tax=Streptomyces scabiei TaxID=1930 RepID=UPI0038F5DE61
MTLDPPDFYAERGKSEDNLARYYTLQVTPTLFGEISLTRTWGRIGTRGREKVMT